jgi:hypothetical protein
MDGPKVRDVMTAEVTTLKCNDKLTLANDIMQFGAHSPFTGTRR